VTLRNFYGSQL